ncbi:retrovirus-related Pol polyprotein from type-1 retrotransposable element R2 [Caerostris darwini]|uniref:Retrovirus-related Pol polyprotein from type-1 retrotransposable element R2 n=1 Tax=Caerostris darwini TaxID=1538125 RepID=A0AAV4MCN3_9ARAC|nr:retrovirus-related Pol polyprotein from type-1 retrotransposable element R2 [Caerostris darwini]
MKRPMISAYHSTSLRRANDCQPPKPITEQECRKRPSFQCEHRTVLIPKNGATRQDMGTWRPITFGNLLRLFTNILARRITSEAPVNEIQRGFVPCDGTENVLFARCLKEGSTESHGLRTFGLKHKLASWIDKIGKFSRLTADQRVSLLSDYAVPRLIHTLKFAPARRVFLDELDRMVRKGVKDWCKLSPSATDGVLYAAKRDGGLAIPKISTNIDTAKASSINRLRKSSLSVVPSVLAGLPEGEISSIWGSSRKRKAGSNWRKTEVGLASGTRIWSKTLHGLSISNSWLKKPQGMKASTWIRCLQVPHLDQVLASPAPFRHELFC